MVILVNDRRPSYQTLALLAAVHPGVSAAVSEHAVLVQALAAASRVALGTAEEIGAGVVAVTHHPTAHHLAGLSTRTHTHTHTHAHTNAGTRTHICTYTRTHVHAHTQTHTHMHTHARTHMYAHAHTHTHTSTHIHTCTHTHTQPDSKRKGWLKVHSGTDKQIHIHSHTHTHFDTRRATKSECTQCAFVRHVIRRCCRLCE